MGIAELITMAMEKEGLPKDECIKKIWMVDSKGLIVKVSNDCASCIQPETVCPDPLDVFASYLFMNNSYTET